MRAGLKPRLLFVPQKPSDMIVLERIVFVLVVLSLGFMTIPDGSRNEIASSGLVAVINAIGAGFVLVVVGRNRFRDVVKNFKFLWGSLTMWLGVTAIQTFQLFGFTHYDRYSSLYELNLYIGYCGYLFVLTCLLNNLTRVNIIFGVLLVVVVAQTLFGFANYYSDGQPFGWGPASLGHHRVTGTYINRNFYANLMVMGLGIAVIPLIIKKSGLFKYAHRGSDWSSPVSLSPFLIIPATVIIAGIVLSGSRGGVLSMLIALGVSTIIVLYSRTVRLRLMFLILSGSSVSILFGYELLKSRFSRHLLDLGDKLDQWKATLELVQEKWVAGYGPGSYEVVYKSNIPFQASPLTYNHAHSDVLELVLEQGVVGVLPLVVFFYLVFYYGLAKIRTTKSFTRTAILLICLFGITGMTAHGFYDFPFQVPANVIVLMTLIAILLASIDMRLKKRGQVQHD